MKINNMENDEASLVLVLAIIVIVGFTVVSALIKWYEWISGAIGFTEFVAWALIAIMVASVGRIFYWLYRKKK